MVLSFVHLSTEQEWNMQESFRKEVVHLLIEEGCPPEAVDRLLDETIKKVVLISEVMLDEDFEKSMVMSTTLALAFLQALNVETQSSVPTRSLQAADRFRSLLMREAEGIELVLSIEEHLKIGCDCHWCGRGLDHPREHDAWEEVNPVAESVKPEDSVHIKACTICGHRQAAD